MTTKFRRWENGAGTRRWLAGVYCGKWGISVTSLPGRVGSDRHPLRPNNLVTFALFDVTLRISWPIRKGGA